MALVDVVTFGIIKSVHLKWISPKFFILPVLFYLMQPFLFLRSLNYEGIAIMNIIWNLLSTVFVTIEGEILFKEVITNRKMAGILLSIVSIYLISDF